MDNCGAITFKLGEKKCFSVIILRWGLAFIYQVCLEQSRLIGYYVCRSKGVNTERTCVLKSQNNHFSGHSLRTGMYSGHLNPLSQSPYLQMELGISLNYMKLLLDHFWPTKMANSLHCCYENQWKKKNLNNLTKSTGSDAISSLSFLAMTPQSLPDVACTLPRVREHLVTKSVIAFTDQ